MNNYKNKFKKDGFLLIKDYFSSEEEETIIKIADKLELLKEEQNKWMIYFENTNNKKTKARLEHFINYNEDIKNILDKHIDKLLKEILDKRHILFKDKLNWKMPGCSGFFAHQDQPAWADFKPNKYITVALFANNTTIENGCLEFVKDKNKEGLLSYNENTTGQLSKQLEKTLNWEHIQTTPRDILIFDSYAPHRSKPNNSKHCRRIFYFTYNDIKFGNLYNNYFIKKRKEFPPNIERTEKVKVFNNKYNLANPIV